MSPQLTHDTPRNCTLRHSLWTFVKAQLSAQVASLCDFVVTILLATICGMFYLYATFIGSVVGGIVNCVINYRWVFHAGGCKKKYIAGKYLLVWVGSIVLNTWGTFALTEWLTSQSWMQHLPMFCLDNVFLIIKGVVALLVGFFWNYQLQRTFVYRKVFG